MKPISLHWVALLCAVFSFETFAQERPAGKAKTATKRTAPAKSRREDLSAWSGFDAAGRRV